MWLRPIRLRQTGDLESAAEEYGGVCFGSGIVAVSIPVDGLFSVSDTITALLEQRAGLTGQDICSIAIDRYCPGVLLDAVQWRCALLNVQPGAMSILIGIEQHVNSVVFIITAYCFSMPSSQCSMQSHSLAQRYGCSVKMFGLAHVERSKGETKTPLGVMPPLGSVECQ